MKTKTKKKDIDRKLSPFHYRVYRAARKIPRGKVATYKDIARAIHNPRAVRAVGNALNKNPFAPHVPCHRVIRSDGRIGGFASGSAKKIRMLRKEGVKIILDKIQLSKFGYRYK